MRTVGPIKGIFKIVFYTSVHLISIKLIPIVLPNLNHNEGKHHST